MKMPMTLQSLKGDAFLIARTLIDMGFASLNNDFSKFHRIPNTGTISFRISNYKLHLQFRDHESERDEYYLHSEIHKKLDTLNSVLVLTHRIHIIE